MVSWLNMVLQYLISRSLRRKNIDCLSELRNSKVSCRIEYRAGGMLVVIVY